jgi:hypothetical protein
VLCTGIFYGQTGQIFSASHGTKAMKSIALPFPGTPFIARVFCTLFAVREAKCDAMTTGVFAVSADAENRLK